MALRLSSDVIAGRVGFARRAGEDHRQDAGPYGSRKMSPARGDLFEVWRHLVERARWHVLKLGKWRYKTALRTNMSYFWFIL